SQQAECARRLRPVVLQQAECIRGIDSRVLGQEAPRPFFRQQIVEEPLHRPQAGTIDDAALGARQGGGKVEAGLPPVRRILERPQVALLPQFAHLALFQPDLEATGRWWRGHHCPWPPRMAFSTSPATSGGTSRWTRTPSSRSTSSVRPKPTLALPRSRFIRETWLAPTIAARSSWRSPCARRAARARRPMSCG